MRSQAPPLLPIFRSRHQADLLAAVLLHPNDEFTVTELARRLGVAASTLHPEAHRLVSAGVFASRDVAPCRS